MAIIKKIDGNTQVIADKSIISHEQLSGREAYGAHPISAIRKLPEKLHTLKEKDEELSNRITAHDEEVDATVKHINEVAAEVREDLNESIEKSQGIKLIEDTENKGKLLFTDYEGSIKSVQGGFLPDEDTLSLNANNEMILKKVYVDEATIIGSGVAGSPLEFKNKPDEETIITDVEKSQIYSGAIKDSSGKITPTEIFNKHFELDKSISDINKAISDIQLLDNSQADKITDLLTRTQGMGGYLNAYNFKTATPTQDKLTQYAIQDIGSITESVEIYNGTKVKNLYNGDIWILTNTPQWTDSQGTVHNAVFSWENQGNDSTVADANNDGVHGLVTGSYEHLEGFIDGTGHISINGLQEELDTKVDKIEYSKDQSIKDGSDDGIIGRAYIRDRENKENSVVLNIQNNKFTVPVRDANGNFYIGSPTQNLHVTNKQYVDAADISLDNKKLDKVDNTGKATQAYVSGNNGQEMVTIDNIPASSNIPRYNDNKNIKSNSPIDNLDVTNKAYVDSLSATKVNTVNTAYQLYGTDWQGNQKTYKVDVPNDAVENTIPYRGTNGALYIPDASIEDSGNVVEGQQAVNKNYVLSNITNALIHGDDTTIIENTNQTFTAVGLYNPIDTSYKTAESLFKATTIVVLEENE